MHVQRCLFQCYPGREIKPNQKQPYYPSNGNSTNYILFIAQLIDGVTQGHWSSQGKRVQGRNRIVCSLALSQTPIYQFLPPLNSPSREPSGTASQLSSNGFQIFATLKNYFFEKNYSTERDPMSSSSLSSGWTSSGSVKQPGPPGATIATQALGRFTCPIAVPLWPEGKSKCARWGQL